jgi:hypothetical protein
VVAAGVAARLALRLGCLSNRLLPTVIDKILALCMAELETSFVARMMWWRPP